MVLVDTSVWVRHLRETDLHLADLLRDNRVLVHPLVIGELACGNLSNRAEILGLLHALPHGARVEHAEVLYLIEERALMGRGIGFIDTALLASTLVSRASLWTLDRPLQCVAAELQAGYRE